MTGNFKALGLALVAVFAMSAMIANAAQAQNGRITSTGPVTLTGINTGTALDNSLTSKWGNVTCPNVKYTGHRALTPAETEAGKKHELIPVNSESATITPHYGACTALGFPMTIDMNGCDYTFDFKETVVANEYKITTTLHCPTGKRIQVTIFTGAAHAIRACTLTLTEQTDYGDTLRAINTPGTGKFDITGTIEGIDLDQSNEFGCTEPGGTDGNVIFHIDIVVTCDNNLGVATSCSLSHL